MYQGSIQHSRLNYCFTACSVVPNVPKLVSWQSMGIAVFFLINAPKNNNSTHGPTRNTWQDYPCFLHVMHQSWMSVLQGSAIQESCHASCILHVCRMQRQSTLNCKMDGQMDARTMPCILHSTCMSHARTIYIPWLCCWVRPAVINNNCVLRR